MVGYCTCTMVKRTSTGASDCLPSASQHHRRQDDESACVYRYRDQDQRTHTQSDSDEYSWQQSAVDRLVNRTASPKFVHGGGLPRRRRCHTSSPTGRWSSGD